MPALKCPSCSLPTPRRLEDVSSVALVNYYRCEPCQAIWTTPKGQPDEITYVSPPPNQVPSAR